MENKKAWWVCGVCGKVVKASPDKIQLYIYMHVNTEMKHGKRPQEGNYSYDPTIHELPKDYHGGSANIPPSDAEAIAIARIAIISALAKQKRQTIGIQPVKNMLKNGAYRKRVHLIERGSTVCSICGKPIMPDYATESRTMYDGCDGKNITIEKGGVWDKPLILTKCTGGE